MNASPEHWQIDAGDAARAVLAIPADARRVRRFEISCEMRVRLRAEPEAKASAQSQPPAWHELTLHADGTQLWRRRVPTQNPGEWDGLDYRCTRSVGVGRSLRIEASVNTQGAQRWQLRIEAQELD